MKSDKKKIEKIYSQIDKLAVKGKEYIYEFYKLIDDLITKGDYNYLELTLFYKYNISILNKTISEIREKTWSEILYQTNNSSIKNIKKILDTNGLYQMSYDIFKDSNSEKIGKIIEIEQYSENSKYYYQNRQFAKIIGSKVTYLQVIKEGVSSCVIVGDKNICIDPELKNYNWIQYTNNGKLSEDLNLINRYKIAVDYLIK